MLVLWKGWAQCSVVLMELIMPLLRIVVMSLIAISRVCNESLYFTISSFECGSCPSEHMEFVMPLLLIHVVATCL